MPCPVNELGAVAPLDVLAISVAQAFLPVPQVAGCVSTRCEETTECVGLKVLVCATTMLARSGTACRAPTEETATAERTMSSARQAFRAVRRSGLGHRRHFHVAACRRMPVLLKGDVNCAGRRPAVQKAGAQAEACATERQDATRWCRGLLRRGLASPRALILLLRTRRLLRLCLAGR